MKTINNLLITACVLMFASTITAQENTVSPEWQKTFAPIGPSGGIMQDIEKDQFDNIYFGGDIDGGGTQSWNTYVGKISPQGTLLWTAAFNSTYTDVDRLMAIDVDAQGNLFAAIRSRHPSGPFVWVVIKYNSSGATQWEKYIFTDSIPTGGYTIPTDIQVYQGDIFVAGQLENSPSICRSWILLKLDPNGNQTAMHQYYRGQFEFRSEAYPVEMVINNSGDIFVGGWSTNIYGQGHYETIKYNTSCAVQWRRDYSYRGLGVTCLNEIIAIDYLNSGGVVVTGRCDVPNAYYDWITIEYNSSGTQQWVHRKDAPGNVVDEPTDIITDGPGNVYVTGFITDVTDKNMHTMKINGAGTMLWERSYNSPQNHNDEGKAITLGPNNEVFVVGTIGPTTGSSPDVGLIKYNTNGDQQYFKRYDREGNDLAADVEVYQVSGRSNIYVGSTSDNPNVAIEMSVVKWSGPGATVTLPVTSPGIFNFNVSGINTSISLILSQFNGTGSITSNLFRNFPINNLFNGQTPNYLSNYRWLIEQNGLSNIQGTMRILLSQLPNHGITDPNAIRIFQRALDGGGAFTELATTFLDGYLRAPITGFSEFILGSDTDPILVQEQTTNVPKEFNLHQNYPNPFNPVTKIRFDIAKQSQTKLVVYDILGKEVVTLFDEFLKPGIYSINFNAENLGSGTYFYTIIGDGFRETKKMSLVK